MAQVRLSVVWRDRFQEVSIIVRYRQTSWPLSRTTTMGLSLVIIFHITIRYTAVVLRLNLTAYYQLRSIV
jgi:hypothetical protein